MKPHLSTSRPARFRPVLTLVLATLALIACWAGLEVYFAFTARPNPTVDYGLKLHEHSKHTQPEGRDGWPLLIDIIKLHNAYVEWDGNGSDPVSHPSPGKYRVLPMYASTRDRILGDERYQLFGEGEGDLRSLESDYQEALSQIAGWDDAGITEMLYELAKCDRLIRPASPSGELLLNMTVGETADFLRPLCFAVHERMKQAREAEDWAAYVDSFEIGMGIARLLSYQMFGVEFMAGANARILLLKQSIADIESGELPLAVRDDLQAAFERQILKMKPSHVIEAELFNILDIAQRVYDQRGRLILTELGNYPIGGGIQSDNSIANIQSLWMPRQQWVESSFREYFDAQKTHVDLPLFERAGANQTEYERLNIERVLNRDLELWSGLTGTPEILLGSSDAHAQLELAFCVILQLNRYRDDNAEFPPTLQAMVPKYLVELPIDPCSESGEPLGYIRLDEPDEFGRQYILYSRGRDLEDNGGSVPLEEHAEAPLNMRSLKGYDYVLNHPLVLKTH